MTRPSLATRVSAFLDEEHVAFALVGATALGVRGFVRGTHDIDFMTVDGKVFDLDWTSALAGAASVQLLRGDFDDPLRGTVRIDLDDEAVDVVVAKWKWQAAVIERSERLDIGEFSVRVPSVADLVLLKLDAGSYLDERDAAALIDIHGREVIESVNDSLADLPEKLQTRVRAFLAEVRERGGVA